MLLVFLLLLTLLLVMSQWEKKMMEEETRRKEAENIRQVLSVWDNPEYIPALEEVKILHDRAEKTSEAEAGRKDLIEQKETLEMARKLTEVAEQDVGLIEKLQNQLEEAKKEKIEDEKKIVKLEEALQEARRDLRIQIKGENAPCWYKLKVKNGKTREQHLFLLNIAVFDDAMIILPRKPPEGAAVEDGGKPYAVEARSLPLTGIPYGESLKDEVLREYLQPIYDLGKAAKVRTYPCMFSVLVWDKTSKEAKARWQRAHDEVLEGLFGTVRVKEDPWPGG